MYDMSTTLTVRLDAGRQKLLLRRARAEGTTVSALVRDILDGALSERPMAERVGHVRGRIRLAAPKDAVRLSIRSRNWRP
jgi:hypothetical protein